MIRIAIVEDDKSSSELLVNYLEKYSNDKNIRFDVKTFFSCNQILNNYNNNFDIIFMDIELPDGNGLETIRKIREVDKNVIVIFVTNMAQYAVKGYEVRAFDFIVKPVTSYNFYIKLDNILNLFEQKKDDEIWISNKDGKMKLNISSIYYIEVIQHMCIYHTKNGNFKATGSLNNIEKTLSKYNFSLCNRCYLVNLRYVTKIDDGIAYLGKIGLVISRAKKKAFIEQLNNYLSLGGGL